MSDREKRILASLNATFAPTACLLEDESAAHAGHAGAATGGSHFRLHLVSACFEGQSRVNRHRLVYDCLRDMMQAEIHALALSTAAPSEVAAIS
ncbi:BolA family protein [Actimicrobium sp. CCC2.4]|uniref:BolA family protein n=1 Tax=Actimicrobium sp. CCC2.4 TaxID=3048606 RepID=UPI002AC8D07D|nr:BolA family protein [Actimicrobium sp. CCC2.4]MEB0133849.1 BolA family protein [Actimicrobium sp. CCC2.4]WPX31391.1 BolA family protein [Actimicrobium sp. CCC2.4]